MPRGISRRNTSIYIEAVHRLSDLGAVVTHSLSGTSQEGFEAEWRMVNLVTVEGDLINRCELFDEADTDAALARFDELSRPAQRLENAASRVTERFQACFAARDWDAMAEMLADDMCDDDRRRVVNAGIRRGRDAEIDNMRAIADVGVQHIDVRRHCDPRGTPRPHSCPLVGRDQEPEAFRPRCSTSSRSTPTTGSRRSSLFDLDDIDAAFEELDARYLAGEAAAHAHTWSVIAEAYAAFNRHELPATTPDWVNIDHRRGTAFAPGDLTAYIRAAWDVAPDVSIYIEAVHRLSNLGAVVTHSAKGTSPEGFDAEWRVVDILTVDGDLISRGEIFDEADLDAALARFDELSRRRGGWKTRQAECMTASRRTSQHVTGTPWRRYWPTTFYATIAVGW